MVDAIVLEAFNPTLIIIVITVLIFVAILTIFGVKFRERISSTIGEKCEIMLSKISPQHNTQQCRVQTSLSGSSATPSVP